MNNTPPQPDDWQWTRAIPYQDAYIPPPKVPVALRTMLDEDWGPLGHPFLFELDGTGTHARAVQLRAALHARGDGAAEAAP